MRLETCSSPPVSRLPSPRDVFDILESFVFSQRTDIDLSPAVSYGSAGQREVVSPELLDKLVDVDSVGLDPILMEDDVNVLLICPPDLDVGHAVYPL